jgi:D-glycero-D-manno-heptose 1,7-bisphosphate phosphatase
MKAVFFDKDGTLIKNVPYNVNTDLIELTDGAAQAVQALKNANWKIFVVSNQSGIARGFFEEKDLAPVWQKLNELCRVEFDGFYFCPHLETGTIGKYSFLCECRKPKAGLILRAAREHSVNLQKSWFVGDSARDAEAGRRAGCRTILIGAAVATTADFRAKNLTEAAQIILND